MRYYSLSIQTPIGLLYQIDPNGLGFSLSTADKGATFSSVWTPRQTTNSALWGKPNLNALNVSIDLPVYMGHEPQGGALLRIWGLGIKTISQAWNLNPVNGKFNTFTLRAGMSKGLPLANPNQSNIIAQGQIWQAFGNWQGTEQTLDIIVYPGAPPDNSGTPISWNWPKGTTLQSALTQVLGQAFAGYSTSVNITTLIAPSDQKGIYRNIYAFFKHLQRYTQKLGTQTEGSSYTGVTFAFVGNVLKVFDGTVSTTPKALAFQDFVGQPTWIDVNTIIFPTVMRGDIGIGDYVTFPTGVLLPYALTTPGAAYPNAPAASSATFKGQFRVTEMHHYGMSAQPDAESWNTTFTAISVGNA